MRFKDGEQASDTISSSCTQEETAVAEATRDLDRAFAGRGQSIGYVSVEDFQVVETGGDAGAGDLLVVVG